MRQGNRWEIKTWFSWGGAKRVRGHGRNLGGDLLWIGLGGCEIRPRGPRLSCGKQGSRQGGRWRHLWRLGELRHFLHEILQLVTQQLVLRLGGLGQLAEICNLPGGFTQGAFCPPFCGAFAPIVV
eukprot:3908680-Amphidinium_carterae.2